MPLRFLLGLALAAPADRVPDPVPEPCKPFRAPIGDELGEDDVYEGEGLDYADVSGALNAVIQSALYCPKPEGFTEVHLTYDLLVGCDGIVQKVETWDDGGAPADYVQCVADVIAKADFPAHDREGGVTVTYPVNVSW